MKKTVKRFDAITEHYWVPTALFLLNINIVHVIYAYATFPLADRWEQLVLVSCATLALTGGMMTKNKLYLIGASVFYLIVLAAAF